MGYLERFLYVAKMRDGTYQAVEAMNHRDVRRYFGTDAESVRKREVTPDELMDQLGDDDLRRRIYERERP
jgi:hypothetical protein